MQDRFDFHLKLEQQAQFIASAGKSPISLRGRNIWNTSTFMHVPPPNLITPFLASAVTNARSAESSEQKTIQALGELVRSFNPSEKENMKKVQQGLCELQGILQREQQLLADYLLISGEKLTASISSMQAFAENSALGQNLYRDEFALRLNLSLLITVAEEMNHCLQFVLSHIKADEKERLKTLSELYIQVQAAVETRQHVIDKYQKVKDVVKPFISLKQDSSEFQLKKTECLENLTGIEQTYGNSAAFYRQLIKKYQLELDFKQALADVQIQAEHLALLARSDARYQNAGLEAVKLHDNLAQHAEAYFQGKTDVQSFKENCSSALADAKKTLNGQYGWRALLAKLGFIVVSIATLGVAPLISKATTGSYRFFKSPRTDDILNPVAEKVNPVLAIAS